MAVRDAAVVIEGDGYAVVTWTGLKNGDTGQPVRLPNYPRKTFQAFGTFGTGGDVDIEGTNSLDAGWADLDDLEGAAISLGAATSVKTALDNPLYVRPAVSGDGSTVLTVVMIAAKD